MIVGEKKKKTLIPVILDDAKPPRCIEEDDILYIKCNSNSYQDIQSLKNIIVNIIGQRKHTIKLDIENKKIIKLLFPMIMMIAILIMIIIILIFNNSFNEINVVYDDTTTFITVLSTTGALITLMIISTSFFTDIKKLIILNQ